MKVYKPTNQSLLKGLLIISAIGIIGMALISEDLKTTLTMGALLGLMDLFAYLGGNGLSYIKISADNKLISRVGTYIDFNIDISKIENIGEGTHYFPVAQTVVAIQTRKQNGTGLRRVIVRRGIWTDDVLGQMIKDMRAINPSIELDEYAQQLVKTGEEAHKSRPQHADA